MPSPGYLPSLEIRRPHEPFRELAIEELLAGNPRWVFIGDSMLGTRIDPNHLGRISTSGDEFVSFLYHAATGPAWWYLAFKNQLVASGVKPRMTFIFFRDTNLTDTMFRLEAQYGRALDEVATPSEPELDALVAAHRQGRVVPGASRGRQRLRSQSRDVVDGAGHPPLVGALARSRARRGSRRSSGTSIRSSRWTAFATTSPRTWRSRTRPASPTSSATCRRRCCR